MILEVYLLFIALAVVAVVLGYFTGDDFYAFIGLFLFFILSIVMFTGTIQVRDGMNVTNTMNGTAILSSTERYNYSTVSDWYTNKLGWLLAVGSGFGIALTLANMRTEKKRKREDE